MDTLSIIDGKYQIRSHVGGGSFSEVYVVTDATRDSQDTFALKLLKNGPGDQPSQDAVEDFKNEFSIIKNLNHPNITGIVDFGFDRKLRQYYYTCDLVRGKNVFDATTQSSVNQILDLFVQALRAFTYLHSYRIYHFDVKAANLLVTEDAQGLPVLKVIDFGLACIDPKGKMIGTPSYMAPEIIAKEKPDGRADLYSLGVLFYYCFTRFNPFRGKGVSETLKNQQTVIAEPVSSRNPSIPSYLDKIFAKLLEKNPADRFSRAEDVLREINFHHPKKFPMETQETLLSYLPEEGRLIGRRREMESFQECCLEIFSPASKRTLCLILLEGAQGLGKTRLLREFKYFAQLKGITTHAASTMETGESRQLAGFLQSLREQPLQGTPGVYLLDDMDPSPQWSADSENFQAFRGSLAHLLMENDDERVPVLLVLATSDFSRLPESLQSLIHSQQHAKHLRLEPFSENEFREYITSLTGLSAPPKDLLSALLSRTEGNPLLITELLKSLIQEGALFDKTGRWKETTFEDLGVDFSKARASGPLEEIFLGRYQKLKPEEREILEALAVAGAPLRASDIALLMAPGWKGPELLAELARKDLLSREELGKGYAIRNAAFADLIYHQVPVEGRRNIHDRAARLYPDGSEERIHHEMRGSDLRHAVQVAAHSGERLMKTARGREAVARYQFILSLNESGKALLTQEEEIEYTLKLGEAHLLALDYQEALMALKKVEDVLARLPNKIENAHFQIDALQRMGAVCMRIGDLEKSKTALGSAMGLLRYLKGDPVRELIAENLRGSILFHEGKLAEARELFETNRRRWEKELSPEDKRKVLNNDLGMVYLACQEFPQAERQFLADLEFFKAHEDQLALARIHYNLGQSALGLKDLAGAVRHYEETVRVAQPLRNTELLLRAYNGLGNTLNLMQRQDDAIRYYERGLDLCERTGDSRSQALILVNMGIILSCSEQFARAHRYLEGGISILKSIKNHMALDWQILVRALLEEGDIARKEQRWADSEKFLKEAKELSENQEGARILRFWVLNTLSELHLARGETEQAQRLLPEVRKAAQTPEEIGQISVLEETMNKSIRATDPAPPAQPPPKQKEAYAYILEINKFINAESDLPFVLKTVLNYALDLSQAEGGMILLLNDNGSLQVATVRNMDESLSGVSQSIARKVLASGEWVCTEKATEDPRFSSESSVLKQELKSVLCFPIVSRRKTIGAIYLDNRLLTNAFEHVDREVLKAFAEQVGIAIENARLLKAYEEKSRTLENKVGEMSSQIEHFQSLAQMSYRGIETRYNYDKIIARSKPMVEIFRLLDKITDTDLAVFIHGESGTGKELIAKALHVNSNRSKNRFVAVNCGALPANLIESELFGSRAGAFTGATRDRKGLFEEANGGTIFLDEMAELDISLQAKLLRVAQEGEFYRVGDSLPLKADVRIVSASNKDIQSLVKENKFREDLYYRLCQIRIDLPPLRERREDIPILAAHFIREEAGEKIKVSSRLMKAFMEYDWPGNIREFENLIKVAVALSENGVIDAKSIPSNYGLAKFLTKTPASPSPKSSWPLPQTSGTTSRTPPISPLISIDALNHFDAGKSWYDYEKLVIAKAYEVSGFNVRKTAELTGIAVATLYKKIKEWNLAKGHPIFGDPFRYDPAKKLKDYLKPVFQAALTHADNKPYTAIAALKVSQGYFYKIMKESS